MLFNTYTYAVFLIVNFLVYLALPLRGRQIFLLATSYVFYCWEHAVWGVLLLISTIIDYCCAILLERYDQKPVARHFILTASLTTNLGLLAFFKYGNFFTENAVGLMHLFGYTTTWEPYHVMLPAGISFYTFQTMSYVIQVYRRQIKTEYDLISFALYVSFFPQLVAGPIERGTHLLPQLKIRHQITREDITYGLTRIIFGLFKKMIIADRLGILADRVFANPEAYPTFTVWIGLLCFMHQIYFDFSGYADIAIGSARLFGVGLMENFRRPCLASSISDFWNRWHISLTTWFRDYLFLPLGGFRKGVIYGIFNGFLVLFLCGLWHGASWHYVFWGIYHAVILSLYYAWTAFRKSLGFRKKPGRRFSTLIPATIFTYLMIAPSGVFFRATDMSNAWAMFKSLAGINYQAIHRPDWYAPIFLLLIIATIITEFLQEYFRLNERLRRIYWPLRIAGMTAIALIIVLFGVNRAAPYIYFQF